MNSDTNLKSYIFQVFTNIYFSPMDHQEYIDSVEVPPIHDAIE